MATFILLLFVVIANADEPCGLPHGCVCSVPILHAISCTNITVFPFFSPHMTTGVLTIKMYDTKLVGLNPFLVTRWPRLQELIFHDNPGLDCSVIHGLERPGLQITSDCDRGHTTGNNLVLPIMGGISFVITAITIITVWRSKIKR